MWQREVERFAAGAPVLGKLVAGLTKADLHATPVAGKWSLQTLVVHVLDSDLIATHRMKRMVAENLPLLIAYDETAFARSLFYHDLDTGVACELFRLNRLHTAEILRRLPDPAFDRAGVHNERGKITLGDIVKMYGDHLEHHLVFAREKLRAMGKQVVV